MSAPKLPVALTPAAQVNLRDIEAYTLREWGEPQWVDYEAALAQALVAIGDNPYIGRARDDVRSGYRAYAVEQHVILYRVTTRAVVVSRIIHRRRDVGHALRGQR